MEAASSFRFVFLCSLVDDHPTYMELRLKELALKINGFPDISVDMCDGSGRYVLFSSYHKKNIELN